MHDVMTVLSTPVITPDLSMVPVVSRRNSTSLVINGIPMPHSTEELNTSTLVGVINAYKHYASHGCIKGGKEARRRLEQHQPLDNDLLFMPCAFTCSFCTSTNDHHSTQMIIKFIPCNVIPAHIKDTVPVPVVTSVHAPATNHQPLNIHAFTKDSITADTSWVKQLRSTRKNSGRKASKANANGRSNTIPEGYRKMVPSEISKYTEDYLYALMRDLEIFLQKVYYDALQNGTTPNYFSSSVPGYADLI